MTATNPGGNTASTYVVLDETSTSVVNIANPNLASFDIETIDLRFGDQAYDVYTLGTDATLVVDDDIQVVT